MSYNGVRNSWLTLATNSSRVRSSRLSRVRSWNTRMVPSLRRSTLTSAAALICNQRSGSPASFNSWSMTRPSLRVRSTISATSCNRTASISALPRKIPLVRNIWANVWLAKRTRSFSSSTSTPSIMLSNNASCRASVSAAADSWSASRRSVSERHCARSRCSLARHQKWRPTSAATERMKKENHTEVI